VRSAPNPCYKICSSNSPAFPNLFSKAISAHFVKIVQFSKDKIVRFWSNSDSNRSESLQFSPVFKGTRLFDLFFPSQKAISVYFYRQIQHSHAQTIRSILRPFSKHKKSSIFTAIPKDFYKALQSSKSNVDVKDNSVYFYGHFWLKTVRDERRIHSTVQFGLNFNLFQGPIYSSNLFQKRFLPCKGVNSSFSVSQILHFSGLFGKNFATNLSPFDYKNSPQKTRSIVVCKGLTDTQNTSKTSLEFNRTFVLNSSSKVHLFRSSFMLL
jgi:hypothetical protein